MTTRVVHCEREPYDVYIGAGSKWASPFKLGEDGTHGIVLRKYRRHVIDQVPLRAALPELRGKVLGCTCPPPCYGDVLVDLVDVQERYEFMATHLPELRPFLAELLAAGLITGQSAVQYVAVAGHALGRPSPPGLSLDKITLFYQAPGENVPNTSLNNNPRKESDRK